MNKNSNKKNISEQVVYNWSELFNKNISLIFLRSEFYQYNIYNNNHSFELKNNHQMNVMNIKKLCRFGVNCNRKESCKYFH